MASITIPWHYYIELWRLWIEAHAWWVGGGFVLVIVGMVVIKETLFRSSRTDQGSWGSATWASRHHVARSGLLHGDGIVLGMWGAHYLRASGEAHVVLFGPTRSGKGRSTIIPTLLSWPHSVLVLDIKGENYDVTAGYRSTIGPVYRFNPTSTDGARINLLDFIRRETMHDVGDAQRLAQALSAPEYPPTQVTEFWRGQAADVLTSVLLWVLYEEPPHRRHLAGVVAFMADATPQLPRVLQQMMKSKDDVVRQTAERLMGMGVTQRSSSWDAAFRLLTVWQDPMVARNTSATDVKVSEIQQGERPVSLFLQVTAEDLQGRLRPLFRVLVDQIMWRLIDRPVHALRHNGQPYRRLLVILDEVAQMKYMASVESGVSLIAGYGIQVVLIFQSPNQEERTFGRKSAVIDNCPVRVMYAPNDAQSAQGFSDFLGPATVTDESRRMAPWLHGGGRTVTTHVRPLLTAAEFMEMGEEEAIIRVTGCKPIRCRKVKYYADRTFTRRLRSVGERMT